MAGLALKPNLLHNIYMATKTELAWLAGIIDGEGSIGVGYYKAKDAYSTQVQLENTNKPMMDKVIDIVESLGVRPKLITNVKNNLRNPKWKVSYRYAITKHSEIEVVLEAIKPYLIAKRKQADILLLWVKARQALGRNSKGYPYPHTEESINWHKQLKELNQ